MLPWRGAGGAGEAGGMLGVACWAVGGRRRTDGAVVCWAWGWPTAQARGAAGHEYSDQVVNLLREFTFYLITAKFHHRLFVAKL